MSSTATPPDSGPDSGSGGSAPLDSARLHWRALEGLYASRPRSIKNSPPGLKLSKEARARIVFDVFRPTCFHAAGAAHGTIYFKMLDDAAFYAANTLVTDRFLLTTSFNLQFLRPIRRRPGDRRRTLDQRPQARVRRRIAGWSTAMAKRSAGAPARSCDRTSRWPGLAGYADGLRRNDARPRRERALGTRLRTGHERAACHRIIEAKALAAVGCNRAVDSACCSTGAIVSRARFSWCMRTNRGGVAPVRTVAANRPDQPDGRW